LHPGLDSGYTFYQRSDTDCYATVEYSNKVNKDNQFAHRLLSLRAKFRAEGDFEKADILRDALERFNFIVIDLKDGSSYLQRKEICSIIKEHPAVCYKCKLKER